MVTLLYTNDESAPSSLEVMCRLIGFNYYTRSKSRHLKPREIAQKSLLHNQNNHILALVKRKNSLAVSSGIFLWIGDWLSPENITSFLGCGPGCRGAKRKLFCWLKLHILAQSLLCLTCASLSCGQEQGAMLIQYYCFRSTSSRSSLRGATSVDEH